MTKKRNKKKHKEILEKTKEPASEKEQDDLVYGDLDKIDDSDFFQDYYDKKDENKEKP